jgi:uncharacterized protein YqgC (DUF456 family)
MTVTDEAGRTRDFQEEIEMTGTILATFNTVQEAQNAINDLTDAGFDSADIGLATHNVDNMYYDEDVSGGEGAGFGATIGSVFGAVAGLVAITIPGIGPVIAAGPLAAALGAITGAGIGAVSGAVTGGITASLVNLGVPEGEANYYAESLRRGSALVSVQVYDGEAQRASDILERHNPIDIDRRVANWTAEGWKGFNAEIDPATVDQMAKERMMDEGPVMSGNTDRETDTDLRAVRKYPRPDSQ